MQHTVRTKVMPGTTVLAVICEYAYMQIYFREGGGDVGQNSRPRD